MCIWHVSENISQDLWQVRISSRIHTFVLWKIFRKKTFFYFIKIFLSSPQRRNNKKNKTRKTLLFNFKNRSFTTSSYNWEIFSIFLDVLTFKSLTAGRNRNDSQENIYDNKYIVTCSKRIYCAYKKRIVKIFFLFSLFFLINVTLLTSCPFFHQ